MRDDDQQYYDDYDDIDDEYPDPADGPYVGDAETLLRRSIDIIATAPTMPLSSSPRIDRDEIIELLEEALQRLPDELRQARWMLKERQEFVAKTRREADEILEAARVQAERMVQRTEVVRAAEQRARQVMETAETDSRRLRHETEDFLDQRLGSFEILLDKLQKTVGRRPPAAVDRCRSPDNTGGDRARRPQQGLLRPGPLTWADRRLLVNAVELLRQPGSHRHLSVQVERGRGRRRRPRRGRRRSTSRSTSTPRSTTSSCRAPSPSPGTARAAAASRPLDEVLRVDVARALHRRPPPTDDAFAIEHGQIDLAAMVREEVLLALADERAVPRRLPRAVPAVRARPRRRAVLVRRRPRSTSAGRRSTNCATTDRSAS